MRKILINVVNRKPLTKKEITVLAAYGMAALLWAWLIFSYIDVVSNNMGSCQYSKLNFFSIFS